MRNTLSRRQAAALLLAWPALSHAASAELRIGASAALSGPAAALGARFHAGVRACLAQQNHQGGIHGRPLRLLLLDDGYEPSRAEANTRQLIEDGDVLALFGYVGTPTSKAALPFVRRAQIPFVGAFTGAALLREPGETLVFNLRAGYEEETDALARAMQAAGVRTLDVLMQADLFGRVGLEAMRAAAGSQGIQLRHSAMVKRNSADVSVALASLLRQAEPADAIFMATPYAPAAAFMLQARKQGFRGGFYALSFTGLEPLMDALGHKLSGLSVAQVVPDASDATLPVVAAYQQAMRDSGERQFDSISLEGYLATRLLIEGLQRAQVPLSRASLAQALRTLGHLDFGGFTLDYRPGALQGSHFVAVRALR
ncbi:ABC transporter substrate-binding protein [Paucibacter sp. APW11]|uniref:ABC transporter substrate-binding protein n=1 Tax=Roseateles aquae TaxID=3077235 RepID=A0ABU3PIQ0_9BURK|nr:ABC transporter substrate-binding protein [Paucibacter sp. APW11]MDT9002315.1 ABC transporter substrate-binding protein [Paucibacter sp. APW11]